MIRGARAAVGVAAMSGVWLCVGLAFARPVPQKSIRDGVFNLEQVESGKGVYEEVCSKCHALDVFGPDYMLGWSGATVGEFFVQIQSTMPYESPGSLSDEDYASVLVYLFAVNGVDAGDQKLGTDVGELYGINIEGPFKWAGNDR